MVKTEKDNERFQAMLDNLPIWNKNWQMLYNMDTCHVIHVGKKNPELSMRNRQIKVKEEEKDVGFI